MSRTYPPVPGEAGRDGYTRVADSSRSKKNGVSCCPVCGEITGGMSKDMSHPEQGWMRYYCGGEYRASVDREGNPAWIGRCGAATRQQVIQFEEQADAEPRQAESEAGQADGQ